MRDALKEWALVSTMAKIGMRCLFPVPIEKLWKLLRLHFNPFENITSIHPDMLSQRLLSAEGEVVYKGLTFWPSFVFEREWRYRGKVFKSDLRVDVSPPGKFREAFTDDHGLALKGSYWESIYAEMPEGTSISTRADFTPSPELNIPGFLQGWGLKREMSRSDAEDFRYFKNNPELFH